MCVVWVRTGLPGRRRSVCFPPAPAECHWQLNPTCRWVGPCTMVQRKHGRSCQPVGSRESAAGGGARYVDDLFRHALVIYTACDSETAPDSETGLGSRRRAACVRRAQPGTCQPGRTPWRTRAPLHRRTAQLTIPRVASCRVQQQHETEQRGLAPNRPPLPARQTALFCGASSLDLIAPCAWPAAPGALVGPAAPLHTVT